MKRIALRSFLVAAVVAVLACVPTARALNIVWVSDNGPDNAFSFVAAGTPDDVFVNLLTLAGHNVIRYNPDATATAALPAAHVTALNTNDVIIIGRSISSTPFAGARADSWNRDITKPLICTGPFLTRTANMGWFNGTSAGAVAARTQLSLVNTNDPKTVFLFEGVLLNGTNTVDFYDEPVDRNTSVTTNPTQGGGSIFVRASSNATATVIADWPAGASVHSGTNILAGYRMFFAAGSQEPASGSSVSQAGKENLTALGEQVFLRAVLLAANNGVPPNLVYDPIIISSEPASVTNYENTVASFRVAISQGTLPKYQWYSNNVPISGATGTNISVVATPGADSSVYHVIITNNAGSVTSTMAMLTVIADTNPPVVLGARAANPHTIVVYFSETLDPTTAADFNRYFIATDDSQLFLPVSAALSGNTAVVLTFTEDYPTNATGHLDVQDVRDRAFAANSVTTNIAVANFGQARGNIVWLSDNGPAGFSGPIANVADDVFTTNLLAYAGYNVIRYNNDNNPSTVLTQAEIDALNTNDLVIIGRSSGSGPFTNQLGLAQGAQWNTNITKPLMIMSPYLVRGNYLGWFTNENVPDDTQTQLIGNTNTPLFSILFSGIGMNRNSTIDPYDRPLERNTSLIASAPVAGGVIVATAAENGATAIAQLPAGTAVRSGTQVLSGYRMLFAGGNREASSIPTAGQNNFTAIGELIFLRAVQAAIDQGAQPGALQNVSFTAGNFSAALPTRTAVNYLIQYRTDLLGPWNPLTNIVGDGTLKSFTDPAPVDSMRFYRAVVQ